MAPSQSFQDQLGIPREGHGRISLAECPEEPDDQGMFGQLGVEVDRQGSLLPASVHELSVKTPALSRRNTGAFSCQIPRCSTSANFGDK